MAVRIRSATPVDRDDIRDIHLRAFPDGEGEQVAALAGRLLFEASDPATINLVAEVDGNVVGHIAFSPVFADVGEQWRGYILAPLAVHPGRQGRGIGAALVRDGLDRLAAVGVDLVFVYGDPALYGQFGFSADQATDYLPPYALTYPFGWQARVLRDPGKAKQPILLTCVAALSDPVLW